MEQTKHTPNNCICGSSDVIIQHDKDGFRPHCCICPCSGGWHETLEQAIADWNCQTAAPDLLTAAHEGCDGLRDIINAADNNQPYNAVELAKEFGETVESIRAAIARAEPKP